MTFVLPLCCTKGRRPLEVPSGSSYCLQVQGDSWPVSLAPTDGVSGKSGTKKPKCGLRGEKVLTRVTITN